MGKAKAYRLQWRPKAREDVHAILAYIGKDNPTRARSFGQELRDKIQQPELDRSGRPGLPDYVRELVAHPNYIIFYRVLSDARIVEILRVKHAAQQTP